MDVYEYTQEKLGYFASAIDELPYIETLKGMPIDSVCGQDCQSLIDKAESLLSAFHDLTERHEDTYGHVVEAVVYQCSVFIRG
jgi:hypothetical protein